MVERVSQPPFPSGADRGNAVLLLLIYFLNGSPDAHLIQAFRREEERNLIGPGNILGTVAVENRGMPMAFRRQFACMTGQIT